MPTVTIRGLGFATTSYIRVGMGANVMGSSCLTHLPKEEVIFVSVQATQLHEASPTETPEIATLQASDRPVEAGPAHDNIALLAYALWQARGCPEGSSEEDWFKAEKELSGQL